MADVLSQEEIDALMEAYSGVENREGGAKSGEKQVRLYDFARPDKFSKEHLRSLNRIHVKHGVAFASALGTLLRLGTRVDLLALEQLTYREYCASVSDGTLFVEVALEPLTSTAIFEFNPVFVSACADLLAGGNTVTRVAGAEVTDIDKAMISPVVLLAAKKYSEAWSQCVAFEPRIVGMTNESTARQILLSSEAVVVCGFEVSVGEVSSLMSICIPASAIEAVLPALTVGRLLNAPSRRADQASEALRKSFSGVEVECHAVLGRTSVPLAEVVDLEVGDLIRLPTKAEGEAEIWVENVAAFRGSLGVSGKNLAVKISRVVRDADETGDLLRMVFE